MSDEPDDGMRRLRERVDDLERRLRLLGTAVVLLVFLLLTRRGAE